MLKGMLCLENGINKNLAGWQIPTSLPLSLIFEITLSSYVPLLSAKAILKIFFAHLKNIWILGVINGYSPKWEIFLLYMIKYL